MPIPKYPKKGESNQEYISRCVSYLIKHEGKTQKQALGQCFGMLRQKRGEKAAPKKRKTSLLNYGRR